MSLFVVPSTLPGVSTGKPLKKICFPSSDTAEIIFQNVKVPKENLIGQEGRGFIYQMEQFQYERLAGAILALGGMKRCLELTKKYISDRQAFGKQLFKRKLSDIKWHKCFSRYYTC
ncbi:MAG: acyl-CoA dehydrogenase family protein [Bacteriovoracaceae bacterium]